MPANKSLQRTERLSRALLEQSARQFALPLSSVVTRPVRRSVAFLILLILPARGAFADTEDMICRRKGMAGISFGQEIDEQRSRLYERVDFGVTYYSIKTTVDITPFKDLIVGVTPLSDEYFRLALKCMDRPTSLIK